jgi:hypothetical protein
VIETAIKAGQENAKKTPKFLEIPKDKKAIINMLVRPKTFGAGLFDYSCQGANWIYSDEAVS